MPPLVLFGQPTYFAGDDLKTISFIACLFRLLQLCLGISILVLAVAEGRRDEDIIEELEECESAGILSGIASHGAALVSSYAAFIIILSVASIATEIPTFIVSGRGTPTNTEPRKSLPCICYINLTLLNVFRCAALALGIMSTYVLIEYCNCVSDVYIDSGVENLRQACPDSFAWVSVMLTLNITATIDVAVAAGVCLCFAFGAVSPVLPATMSSEQRWSVLCRCCFGFCSLLTCCVFGGAEAFLGDFGGFAMALSNLMKNNGIFDITFSDIIAGLSMVQRTQRARRLEIQENLQDVCPPKELNNDNLPDQAHTRSRSVPNAFQGANEGDISKSLYRSAENLFTTDSTATKADRGEDNDKTRQKLKVLSRNNSRDVYCMAEAARFMPFAQAAYTSYQGKIRYDYGWKAHTVTLKATAGIADEDIVFASFRQGVEATPYFIALDHEWKTVVLAVRGTLSFESALADISLKCIELKSLGEELGFQGEGQYCHAGMLACSEWIYRDLQKHGKLDEVLTGEYSGYRLRIVGHSLGAACAAILGLFLRSRYPNLRCLAFSPPGCVFSEGLTEECSKWTTSYVLDADIIPRLSIESFEALRDELLETICRIKIPKCKVSNTVNVKDGGSKISLSEANNLVLCDPDEAHDSDFKEQIERFFEFQKELKAQQSTFARLYPPGEIIQLFKTRDVSSFKMPMLTTDDTPGQALDYTAVWIQRSELESILLSTHLLSDHDPINVKRRIQDSSSKFFGLAPPYSSVFDSST